jgi:hypothetical protein
MAWWCETVKAGPMIREARRHNGDIPAAAPALGIALTDHATVLARATAAVARIKAGMAWAQRTGVLHEFNQEYQRRRIEAAKQGRGFPPFQRSLAKLGVLLFVVPLAVGGRPQASARTAAASLRHSSWR